MSNILNTVTDSELNELITVRKELAELKKKEKALSDKIKDDMINSNVSNLSHNNHAFSLAVAERVTIISKTKDEFITLLNQMGLKSCLTLKVDVNKETLDSEINAGKISQNTIDKYVKTTQVKTLKID